MAVTFVDDTSTASSGVTFVEDPLPFEGWVGPLPTTSLDLLPRGEEYVNLAQANATSKLGFVEAITDWGPENVAFTGDFYTAKEIYKAIGTMKKLNAGETPTDEELLDFNIYLQKEQRASDATFLGDVGQSTKGMIKFMAEIGAITAAVLSVGDLIAGDVATIGAKVSGTAARGTATELASKQLTGSAVKRFTTRALQGGMRQATRPLAEKMVAGFTQKILAAEVPSTAAKAFADIMVTSVDLGIRSTVLTVFNPMGSVRGVAEQRLRGFMEAGDENARNAVLLGIVDAWTTNFSESIGEDMGRVAGNILGSEAGTKTADMLLGHGTFRMAARKGVKTLSGFNNYLTGLGFNGIASEMAEERLDGFLKGMFGIQGEAGLANALEQASPTWRQAATELVTFAIPGVVAGTANYAQRRNMMAGASFQQAANRTRQIDSELATFDGSFSAEAEEAAKENLVELVAAEGNAMLANPEATAQMEEVVQLTNPTSPETAQRKGELVSLYVGEKLANSDTAQQREEDGALLLGDDTTAGIPRALLTREEYRQTSAMTDAIDLENEQKKTLALAIEANQPVNVEAADALGVEAPELWRVEESFGEIGSFYVPPANAKSTARIDESPGALPFAEQKARDAVTNRINSWRVDSIFPSEEGGAVSDDALVNRLNVLVKSAIPLREATAEMRREAEAKIAGEMKAAFDTSDDIGGFFRARAAQRGARPIAELEPFADKFTKADVNQLFQMITNNSNITDVHERANTVEAMLNLVMHAKLPTPSEIKLLENAYGAQLAETLLSKRPISETVWRNTVDILNLPRTFLTMADLSAVLRQGGMLFLGENKEWRKSLVKMLPGIFNAENFNALEDANRNSTHAELAKQSNLYLAPRPGESTANLAEREETFISTIAEKLPVVGGIVRASERAFIGFTNTLRMAVFNKYANLWGDSVDAHGYRQLAAFLNRATGRGDFGEKLSKGQVAKWFKKNSAELSTIFFSPQFLFSRVQIMGQIPGSLIAEFGKPKFGIADPRLEKGKQITSRFQTREEAQAAVMKAVAEGTPDILEVRDLPQFAVTKVAAKNLFAFYSAWGTMLLVAAAAGFEVEEDPRSSDFGKIKVDNTRIDLSAGMQPVFRYLAQFITGVRKTTTTGQLRDVKRSDVVQRFLRSKLAPAPSALITLLTGKTFTGQDITEIEDASEVISLTPLFLDAFLDAMEADGVYHGLFAGSGEFLGLGVTSFDPRKRRQREPDTERRLPFNP